jgi:hypothetical protein
MNEIAMLMLEDLPSKKETKRPAKKGIEKFVGPFELEPGVYRVYDPGHKSSDMNGYRIYRQRNVVKPAKSFDFDFTPMIKAAMAN